MCRATQAGTMNQVVGSSRVTETEVVEKAKRQLFMAEYKQRILAELDRTTQSGEIGAVLRGEFPLKFAFISQEKVAFPIAVLCRVMQVSTSGYYASQGRSPSPRARREVELGVHVAAAHAVSK